jgi:two-component system sensor histidine kinase ChiS
MWFGTNDGLNKYDGYNFTIYKHSNINKYSLTNSAIESIYEDKSGNLWIGTENGLNLYDRNNDHFIHNADWPQGEIMDFLEIEDGRWFISI